MKKEILFVLMLVLGTAMSFAQDADATVADTATVETTPPDDEYVIHTADVCFDLDKGTIVVNETVSASYHETYDVYEHYGARQLHFYTIENGQKELLFENFCRADIMQKGKKLDVYLWPTELTDEGYYESKLDFTKDAEAVIHFVVGKKSLKCSLDEMEGVSLPDQLKTVGNQRKEALETYKSLKSFEPWIEMIFKTIEQTYNFCIGLRGKDLSLDETRAMCSKYLTQIQKSYDRIAELQPCDSDFEKMKLLDIIEGLTPKTQQLTGKIGGDDTPYTIVVKSYTQMESKYDDTTEGEEVTDSIEKLVMVMLEISSPAQKAPLVFVDNSIAEFASNDALTLPAYRILDDGKIEGTMNFDSDGTAGTYTEVLTYDKDTQTLSRIIKHAKGVEKDRREIEYTIKYLNPEELTKIE